MRKSRRRKQPGHRKALMDKLERLHEFKEDLNGEDNAIIVVEGKKDRDALREFGINLEIIYWAALKDEQFRNFKGTVVLLLDADKEGVNMIKRFKARYSMKGKRVELRYWKMLKQLNISNVEGLMHYYLDLLKNL